MFAEKLKEWNTKTSLYKDFFTLALLLGAVLFFSFAQGTEPYPELREIHGWDTHAPFSFVSAYFKHVAEEKGGVYAFELLKKAELPDNIDLHLLGHVVGDELYTQEGIEGIELCTHDFRNACSHTMVIGGLLEHGEGVLPKVEEACHQAPGGKGAYTMCFHGFGHGVLAFNEYDFEKTVNFCKQVGSETYQEREYVECVGGAVMEILGGGGHDRDTWLLKREEYLSKEDPLSLCKAGFMKEVLQPICYTYLTPHLFTFKGGDLGNPTEQEFKKAFAYCDRISTEEVENRKACFGGLGKEFVGLAQGRDIRKIEQMTEPQLRQVYQWCTLALNPTDISSCTEDAINSLFWGGENDRGVSVRFCGVMNNDRQQEACFDVLTEIVGFYKDDHIYYEEYCTEIPELYKEACLSRLNLKKG